MTIAVLLSLLIQAGTNPAADPLPEHVYATAVKPLLKERCWACHGGLKQEAGLRLDTAELIRRGGDSGAAVTAGDPEHSLLVERVTDPDASSRMPPEGEPLTSEEIAKIKAWIFSGAIGIKGETAEADPHEHWAFRQPEKAKIPRVEGLPDNANPIDAFILSRLQQEQLTPRPQADKPTLLRRAYLDLIGLPPTPDELHAFLADDSPNAWETVVDRLLNDPRYGERWARHWMDVWRYSDWYGRRHVPDVWNSAPQIWRWRDWIVNSLNADKGYDRMVAEMLAADEICPEDREAGYATGYLVRNWYALNPNDWMRANVEHTGKAFLGLTFNCAHCHDHKYDPITHDEYFHLWAFFEPIGIRQERVPGEPDPGPYEEYEYGKLRKIERVGAVRIFDKSPDRPTWFYTAGDERNRLEDRGSIPPRVPDFLSEGAVDIESIELPPKAWYPGLQPEIQQTVLNEARNALSEAESQLRDAQQKPPTTIPELEQRLAAAQAKYQEALQQAQQSEQPGALSGQQSLLLDASAGRRVVQNVGKVQELKVLPDGAQFEFTLLILADAYVNFQLARDYTKLQTSTFVGFDHGKIIAYRPGGGHTLFDIGAYDFAAGQRRFHVTMRLDTAADQSLLSVKSLADGRLLVDNIPVALNGWNPVGDSTKAVTFDARTGVVAVVDDLRLTLPNAAASSATDSAETRLFDIDFEPPLYVDGTDVVGIDGWIESPALNVAPAKSLVSSTAGNSGLNDIKREVDFARRAIAGASLPLQVAEARVQSAQAELASVDARIAADNAKYNITPEADAAALTRAASQAERQAAVEKARAEVLSSELALLNAEAKPQDDNNREKELQTASTNLAKAKQQVEAATAALAADADKSAEEYTPLSQVFPKTSTGRRRALAEWITSRKNPLTARVAINHIWMRHFHAPFVSSVYDFGRNGADPTHPQLLDWLAVELMESKWSMKHIHRLILTSHAWQRTTSVGKAETNFERDPDNQLLWRMNTGRMEAEVLRDSLLYCGGKLDLTMGGQELENKDAMTTYRRSLYYSVFPEDGGNGPLATLFDAPNPLDCYRRTRSVVPQQALALTNSDLIHQLSQKIASDWVSKSAAVPPEDESSRDERFVVEMFEMILSRPPKASETSLCLQAIKQQEEIARANDSKVPARQAKQTARESLVRVLLNHNDFVTIR